MGISSRNGRGTSAQTNDITVEKEFFAVCRVWRTEEESTTIVEKRLSIYTGESVKKLEATLPVLHCIRQYSFVAGIAFDLKVSLLCYLGNDIRQLSIDERVHTRCSIETHGVTTSDDPDTIRSMSKKTASYPVIFPCIDAYIGHPSGEFVRIFGCEMFESDQRSSSDQAHELFGSLFPELVL
ncbi:hypothetical protein PORCRE_1936 [Porphyromonas crevioricanis JCM 15906]|uniref:Uncharacterized protein n=1 Tax=Porphyromonas crevioricanis JCM 15906 TaxID=1305617 RepID=T1CQV6_9PORP|nr:hypothetical protein PORCRE_1936 [Porphyromonas crevioricanis JCM 15906]